MRFSVIFELTKMELPRDFRPAFVSFIKHCLSQYGQEYFDAYYKDRDAIMKRFTFGVRLNRPKFSGDVISLGGNMLTFTLSTSDMQEGMLLYNAVVKQKSLAYPLAHLNSMKICAVRLLPDVQVRQPEIVVKFLSPLVVREHDRESNHDVYVHCQQDAFVEKTRAIVAAQISRMGMDERLLDGFSIEPVMPKKTVVLAFKIYVDASLGVYKLSGQPELLNFLYQAGMGSRRSQGFGFFEILA